MKDLSSVNVIGQRMVRVDALGKVLGQAKYPADLRMKGMLYGRALRSLRPHARILRIDTERARQLPGVVAVLTAADIEGPNVYGRYLPDQPVLARDKVRHMGDAVALVVAETEELAEEAIRLIEVEYEPLPGIFDPKEALQPGVPLVHEKGNLLSANTVRLGEADLGFAEAEAIVEGVYRTQFVEHAYLQTESGLAYLDEEGRVVVCVATQHPHRDLKQIAYALGLPEERVRLIQPTVGGAFGGREDMTVQCPLALLALKTGQPVKLAYSREESFIAHTKRHPFQMHYRTGARRDGRLVALEAEIVSDAGAYAMTSPQVLRVATSVATGPYHIPNVKIDSCTVYTNNTPTAAMRGFGATQTCFASEIQMNKLAVALRMDPIEFRLKNVLRPGQMTCTGQVLGEGVGVEETILRAAEMAAWPKKRKPSAPGKVRGIGVACGYKNVGYSFGYGDRASVVLEVYGEHIAVKAGAIEAGQGVTTILRQIAAAELGVNPEEVEVIYGDTAEVLDAGSGSASRLTFMLGNAVRLATNEARQRIMERGERPAPGEPPIICRGDYQAPPTNPTEGGLLKGVAHFSLGYGTHIVEVEVDTETGVIELTRVVAAHDVGRAINPLSVEGQIEGGVLMAQGYALLEEYVIEQGVAKTVDLHEYLIPTAADVPKELRPLIIEVPDPYGPFGAKGVGEMTTLPLAPAIVSAVYDATGLWFDELPLKPERVLQGLHLRPA
ncbi:MAG: xanthine dehydrogenase family protein molybdopterin-binding subunit [Chloroflexi bacterium]|nr:xanthine dehydrogenase family protein molybdopterin-binding subunit [Chloroflexota bacterium]MCL5075883.1 xanthine dehydrogenase family protein molybdopterin-binding subunit [Chloroflexota bacterium]